MLSKNQLKQVKLLEQKKYRQQNAAFVAEGPKVVGDLLRCGYQPTALFAIPEYDVPHGLKAIEITHDELRKLSFLQHPQQVLAVFPIPKPTVLPEPTGLCLALDNVQDPGNLGTIIRIADWFGINTIYCSHETADVWNPKVVQASMGSIARVRIYYTDLPKLLQGIQLPVYGTLLDGQNIYQQSLSNDGIIVMGNEGNGITDAVRPLISHKLYIPCYREGDSAESLNVAIATAITCAEFRRRQ